VIRPARSPAELDTVRRLFREHMSAVPGDLAFQKVDQELGYLPGRYAEPQGGIWLAEGDCGVVALRPLEDGVCEMKRLYVAPSARGTGLGRRLAELCLAAARDRGYAIMRLDTLTTMDAANHIYRSLGFRKRTAYYDNPLPDVRYYELELT
jgi:putative acetyltransferase